MEYKIILTGQTDAEMEVDQGWLPPSLHKIKQVMGDKWFNRRIDQASSWINRKEAFLVGKGAAYLEASKINADPNLLGRNRYWENNTFYKAIVSSTHELNDLIQNIPDNGDLGLKHLKEFEQFQLDNTGFGTWNWDYNSIYKDNIVSLKEYNAKPINWNRKSYEQGLQDYYNTVAPYFSGKTFKYNIADGIMNLPAGSFWAGVEATASKEIHLSELSEGLELLGKLWTVRYTRRDIMKIRKALGEYGMYDSRIKSDYTGVVINDDYLTVREILMYELVIVRKGDVSEIITKTKHILKDIGHPLKPGLRIQHGKYSLERPNPKQRIFMMNFITINALFAPIIHFFQTNAIAADTHISWVDKEEMLSRMGNQIRKVSGMKSTKFLSIDYSKFDHTVENSLLYFIRRNYVEFVKQLAHDDFTRDILNKLADLLVFMCNRTYLMYPAYNGIVESIHPNVRKKSQGTKRSHVTFELIYLRNQLASGVIDTQLAGTHKSQSDIRHFLLSHEIVPDERLVTLSDDVIVYLTQEEYSKIGSSYEEVNEVIGDFFTSMGAKVNPKKQPPSHDWGLFLQYLITDDPLYMGQYSRNRTMSKIWVSEFGVGHKRLSDEEFALKMMIDRIGQISSLNNINRYYYNNPLLAEFDESVTMPRYLEKDRALQTIIASRWTLNNGQQGRIGEWFGDLIGIAQSLTPDLLARLGEQVYSKSGLKHVLSRPTFSMSMVESLPIDYRRTLWQLDGAARSLGKSPVLLKEAIRRVYGLNKNLEK